MAGRPPTGGSSPFTLHGHSHDHGHGHGHCQGECHGHGHGHGGGHGGGVEVGTNERTSAGRVLEKLKGLLAEDSCEPKERDERELDWSVVTCPNLHPLDRSEDERHPWSCDMARYRELAPEASIEDATKRAQPWKRFHKNRYGMKQSERWNCLSAYTDFGKHRNEPVYHCWACNFSICGRCYIRAKAAGENVESVKQVMNSRATTCAWMRSKLMVVGQARVGKTATVRTLMGRDFVEDLDSTVGVKLSHAKTTKQGLSWRQAEEEIKHGHAVTAAATLVSGRECVDEEAAGPPRRRSAFKEVVATSEDGSHALDEVDRVKILGSFDLEVFPEEVNDNSISFTVWDFSGQTVFYSLHQLFLTSYGVYLVVFNCLDFLEAPTKALEFVTSWLSSVRIHAAAAPVILVGTHIDRLDDEGELGKVDRELVAVTKNFPQVVMNKTAGLQYFPLSNADGKGVKILCESIESTSRGQEFLQLKVPLKWLRCLDAMMKNNVSWISRELVEVEAQKLGIRGVAELDDMLSLFHELGVIVHLTVTSVLDNIVVFNPQWLLDEISKLIRDPKAHPYKREEVDSLGLTEDWKRLEAEAICTFDYLHFLWGFEQVGFFVDLLQATMLLSQWNFDGSNDKLFLVPSLVKATPQEEKDKTMAWPTCIFDFSGFHLPYGCFQRLVCLCVDYGSGLTASTPPVITKTWAKFEYISKEAFIIGVKKDTLTLAVEPPEAATKFLAVLTSMVHKVNLDAMGGGLSWKMFYVGPTSRNLTSDEAKSVQLKPWFDRPQSTNHEAQTTHRPAYTAPNLDAFLGI